MALPDNIKPSMFAEVIVNESDTLCEGFKKLIHFSVLLYRYQKWMHSSVSSSAALSDAFKSMVCNVVCPDDTTTIPTV